MPGDPIANDGGKLADLQCKTPVVPRRDAKCVFIQADFSAVLARIETTVNAGLRKEIDLRPELRVDEKRQTRIEKIVDLAVDEPRRRLIKMVKFGIGYAAQSRAQI